MKGYLSSKCPKLLKEKDSDACPYQTQSKLIKEHRQLLHLAFNYIPINIESIGAIYQYSKSQRN